METKYYYNIETGNIKYLDKNTDAVETVFDWYLQGRKCEKQSSLILNVTFEEYLCSKQIKNFW